MNGKLIKSLKKIDKLNYKKNIPLKKFTTMKVGGPAELFLIPKSISALKKALAAVNKYSLPVLILGKGSNIIVSDMGFQGIVIYTSELNNVLINDNKITAESGISLSQLASKALDASLTGLEFGSGIPGTLGGALFMNAGAYGCEMKEIVSQALVFTPKGDSKLLSKKELQLSYRSSLLQKEKLTAARITLLLKKDSKTKILSKMKELNKKRREKQPLDWPSAGSIFKRPEGHYSGVLIEKTGMKGASVGNMEVSKKHAGFIINRGQATAEDAYILIKKIQEKVYQNSGLKLEVEPKFIGDFSYINNSKIP